MQKNKILVEVSNRHVHLCPKDIGALFGKGHRLKKIKKLSQPVEFAAAEIVTLINKNKKIAKVRVLGPAREKTQVELSRTDAINLGLNPPVRLSGDLKNSPGIEIQGSVGSIQLKQGVIISQRHLHASPKEARLFGLKDKDVVGIKIPGKRGAIFNNIPVRVSPNYRLALHLDTDEGNAAGIKDKTWGVLIKNH